MGEDHPRPPGESTPLPIVTSATSGATVDSSNAPAPPPAAPAVAPADIRSKNIPKCARRPQRAATRCPRVHLCSREARLPADTLARRPCLRPRPVSAPTRPTRCGCASRHCRRRHCGRRRHRRRQSHHGRRRCQPTRPPISPSSHPSSPFPSPPRLQRRAEEAVDQPASPIHPRGGGGQGGEAARRGRRGTYRRRLQQYAALQYMYRANPAVDVRMIWV